MYLCIFVLVLLASKITFAVSYFEIYFLRILKPLVGYPFLAISVIVFIATFVDSAKNPQMKVGYFAWAAAAYVLFMQFIKGGNLYYSYAALAASLPFVIYFLRSKDVGVVAKCGALLILVVSIIVSLAVVVTRFF